MASIENVVYDYDGSFEGFLCCVFESFEKREIPIAIETFDEEQSTLFRVKTIDTDQAKAQRVRSSIQTKIGLEAKELLEYAFLTNLKEKELHMLYFMRLGYKVGPRVCEMLANEDVSVLKKAVLHLTREAHLLKGFIRFSEYDGVLMAEITPKNNVLPLLAEHFCSRYSGECFMIFDKVHKMALVYKDGQRQFLFVEKIEPPKAGPEEEYYRALWRKFYDTIGIEGRFNPRCRRTLMPMRYWDNMTEFQ